MNLKKSVKALDIQTIRFRFAESGTNQLIGIMKRFGLFLFAALLVTDVVWAGNETLSSSDNEVSAQSKVRKRVRKERKKDLDKSNNPADVTAYLIDKGFNVSGSMPSPGVEWSGVAKVELKNEVRRLPSDNEFLYRYENSLDDPRHYHEMVNVMRKHDVRQRLRFSMNDLGVAWFVHDDNRYYGDEVYSAPWTIQMQDIESINVSADSLTISQVRESDHDFICYPSRRGENGELLYPANDERAYLVVDIKLKDAQTRYRNSTMH